MKAPDVRPRHCSAHRVVSLLGKLAMENVQ